MSLRTGWFLAALVVVSLLSVYAPKIAGALVILVVMFFAIELADKRLI